MDYGTDARTGGVSTSVGVYGKPGAGTELAPFCCGSFAPFTITQLHYAPNYVRLHWSDLRCGGYGDWCAEQRESSWRFTFGLHLSMPSTVLRETLQLNR